MSVSRKELIQYLATALWSSVNDDGEPLDREFSAHDFSVADKMRASDDMSKFLALVCQASDELLEIVYESGDRWAHDFWLARNGHGAGFFDGPEHYDGQENADTLQAIAKTFKELNVCETEDGPAFE